MFLKNAQLREIQRVDFTLKISLSLMYRHESLDEVINQLKSLSISNRKIVTPQANERLRKKAVPLINDKQTYRNNPPQSTHLHTSSENIFSKTSINIKTESTSDFNKTSLNLKPTYASMYPSTTNSPRIVRPSSARMKDNPSQPPRVHIRPPDSNINSPREINPRFSQNTGSIKNNENTESKLNISQSTSSIKNTNNAEPKPNISQTTSSIKNTDSTMPNPNISQTANLTKKYRLYRIQNKHLPEF